MSTVDPLNKQRGSQVGCWPNGPRRNIPEASLCAREEEEEEEEKAGRRRREGVTETEKRARERERMTVRLFDWGWVWWGILMGGEEGYQG